MVKGADTNADSEAKVVPWAEIKEHVKRDDRWIVVDGDVYDVTQWQRKHPGGARILGHFAGQDATDAFHAMHPNIKHATKYMKPLWVGRVEDPDTDSTGAQMMLEFRALRSSLERRGMFDASMTFFTLHLVHIVLLEAFAYFLLVNSGGGLGPFFLTGVILAVSQAQAGWTQHDYGHLSVFRSSKLNHFFHQITIGFIKSASSHWWNFRHFQHHVKPNVFKKDPDITVPAAFILGKKIPVKWGKQKRSGPLPYQHQHRYFWLLGPIALVPLIFRFENLYFMLKHRDWLDMIMVFLHFAHFDYLFTAHFETRWATFALYMVMQVLDGTSFIFVTQMNHLPMEIDEERDNNWVTQQTVTACNVEPSLFNDWFTGHLNYQIEHHLFPSMPRHNLSKVAPEVQAFCKKHNQPYIVKPISTACVDILTSLKDSGHLWHKAYLSY